MSGWFVTGTDTGVGKTLVCGALLSACASRGLRVAAMKPVAAGTAEHEGEMINEDVIALMRESNVVADLRCVSPYALAEPIAPHIAAHRQGIEIDLDIIKTAYRDLCTKADIIIVEGVGGFRVPLGASLDSAEMAHGLGLPVILVVGMRLGCLNHALLAAEAIDARGLVMAGWIANSIAADMAARDENIAALDERLPARRIGTIEFLADPGDRKPARIARYLDIAALFSQPHQ